MTILDHIDSLEQALAARGFPAMSPWWRATLEQFYSTDRRQLVLRVGRRGGKSSTLCRIAVLEALYGEHRVPPGDLGIVAIVSVSRDEASQRLRTIRAILDALRVRYRPTEGGIELVGRPVAFRTFAATLQGVAGFTCICAIADEVARWRDSDTGANPASEVLASLRPTMATQPSARIFLSSSPLGTEDAHAVAFDAGDSQFQAVAFAETWVANPSVSEERTRQLEPDERKWRREYAAQPQAGALAAFDTEAIDRAFSTTLNIVEHSACEPVLLLDPSAGAADSYTFAVARWRLPTQKGETTGAQPRLELVRVAGWDKLVSRGITSDRIVEHVAAEARAHGCSVIHADQFERFALQAAFAQRGFRYMAHSWTQQTKERAVERVRGWLRDGVLVLPPHDRLRRELLAFEERIAPSGALTFRGRQGSHDDFAMLVVLAALVDIEGQLPGSPIYTAARRAQAAHLARLERVGEMLSRAGAYASADDQRRERAEVRAELAEARFAASRAAPDGRLPAAEAAAWDSHLARGGTEQTDTTEDTES